MLLNCGVGEDFENPLDSKEIKPVNTKGNQPWPFIGRTDAEALVLWLPNAKAWKRPWCWEKLRAGWQWGDRSLNGIINSVDMRLSKLHKIVKDREAWYIQSMGVAKSLTWLSDWTTTDRETERDRDIDIVLYDLVSEVIKPFTPHYQTRHLQRSTLFHQEAT